MTRLEALCNAWGLAGGTIHQIANLTGCSVNDLLDKDIPSEHQGVKSDYAAGWFTARMHTIQENKNVFFQGEKGNTPFWIGVAESIADKLHFIE